MNYLLKNSRRENGTRRPILWTLAILALAGFFYSFTPKFANQNVYSLARPIWITRDYIADKFTNFLSTLSDKKRLAAENLSLHNELSEARVALIGLDDYKKENAELKKILGRNPTDKKILAVILAKPNRSSYDTLVLDVGKNQNITEGDLVLFGDFMLGTVREVYGNYSKATLISSPGETLMVRIGESGIDTKAIGRGNGNFIAKLPKEIIVNKGDLIKSPGLMPKFFGVVEDIEQTETSSLQFILFKLPVNINALEWVEVVKK